MLIPTALFCAITVVLSACGGGNGNNNGGSQNISPIALNDSAITASNTATTFNVQTNDIDSDGSLISTTIVTQPSSGALSNIGANGSITYTPNNNFSGNDIFTYTVQDNDGADSNTATVTVTVTPPVTHRLTNIFYDRNSTGVFRANALKS